jgi:hypothetical protein
MQNLNEFGRFAMAVLLEFMIRSLAMKVAPHVNDLKNLTFPPANVLGLADIQINEKDDF